MSNLPELNQPYAMPFTLEDNSTGDWFIDPPIVAGDFQVSKDFGALVNLTNLPLASPAGSSQILLSMTADEMNANKVSVYGHDPDGLWPDILIPFILIDGSEETLIDILEGDITETNIRHTVKKKGTSTVLVDKEVAGSLLDSNITITTSEPT